MRNYTNFKVIEGTYTNVVKEFDTFGAALAYIEEEYGANNAVDQLVQIDASNPEEDIEETFNELEIYDMLMKKQVIQTKIKAERSDTVSAESEVIRWVKHQRR